MPEKQKQSEQENFFRNSSVTRFFSNNCNHPKDNIIIDYDGRSYIRMMKQFYHHKQIEVDYHDLLGQYQNEYDGVMKSIHDIINSDFHLRFYIPKSTICTIGKKIKKIVIMFNGLNETENYDFFDMIGEYFADNDIAAVLLPTPFNLNRRVRNKTGQIMESTTIASEKGNDILFFANYLKSYKELIYLIEKINLPQKIKALKTEIEFINENSRIHNYSLKNSKNVKEAKTTKNKIKENDNHKNLLVSKIADLEIKYDVENDFGFYNCCFDSENIEISLLGYSLGGLRALGFFMNEYESVNAEKTSTVTIEEIERKLSKKQKIHSCISVLSGPNLYNAEPPVKNWKSLLNKINKRLRDEDEILKKYPTTEDFSTENLMKIFRFLYFNHKPEKKADRELLEYGKSIIRDIIDNFLAISGGSDQVVEIEQMQRISPDYVTQGNSNAWKTRKKKKQCINHIIVSRGDHHPSIDSVKKKNEWHELLPLVEKSILNFINSCGEKHYKRSMVIEKLKNIITKNDEIGRKIQDFFEEKGYFSDENNACFITGHFKFVLELLKNTDISLSEDFKQYYIVSKAFYPNFPEVIRLIFYEKGMKLYI